MGPTPLIDQKSQDIACSRRLPDFGSSMPVFSARYTRIAPNSKTVSWAADAVVVDDRWDLSIRRDCKKLRRVLLARTEVYAVDRIRDAHLFEHYRRLRPVRRGPSEQLNHCEAFLVLSSRLDGLAP